MVVMESTKVLNLTQHSATPEQIAQGVVEPTPEVKAQIQSLLTFEELPGPKEIIRRATRLADIAAECGVEAAMIGGAPYLMAELERTLLFGGVNPLYAFSRRESVDQVQPDGSVKKVAVFRHVGFVPAVTQGDCWNYIAELAKEES